jgi:hypothetical protein
MELAMLAPTGNERVGNHRLGLIAQGLPNGANERNRIMPKFYVQSGLVAKIVTANDAYSAALWAMHLVMEDVVPVEQVDWLDSENQPEHGFADGLLKLGDQISVSEVGYGRDEAGRYDTADALAEWNQLVIAMANLEARLSKATVSNHRMVAVGESL